jgi:predicted Zn-ribbon and HTH transcriptional regulator
MAGTIRQQIMEILGDGEMGVRDISQTVGISEKLVYEHLEHIVRSLSAKGKQLSVDPYKCLVCGYIFKDRKRVRRPGRCPKCKQGHIQGARFRIDWQEVLNQHSDS